jgi:RNA polymerase sigma-70 factor (ECF subfamily)
MDSAALDQAVDAARDGDPEAFGRLWQELSPRVAAYFRAQGVPDHEDLTSEVFLAAFRQMRRFIGGGAAFRALLFSIAHHRHVDWVRRQVRRGPIVPWDELREDPRTTGSAEEAALTGLGEQRVVALLTELTPDQRAVVALRVLGELTLEETARVLGRDVGSVKSLQHRGLARLRRKLATDPYPRGVTGRLNTRHA